MKTLIPFPPLQKSLIIRKMLTPIHAASSLLLMVFLSSSFNAEAIPPGISIDKKSYPVTGIDISQYVGPVDFKQVKKNREEVDFVYMRATLGTAKTDTKFETYYTDAKEEELPVGVYHFFKFREGGSAQANHFLKTIKGKDFELPLVLDVEEWGNRGQFNRQTIITNIRAFIRTVERERNEKVILYSNRNTYNKYLKGNFPDAQIWICSFKDPDSYNLSWLFWQHSHRGKVRGATGLVDLNTFNGSKEDWQAFLKDCENIKKENQKNRKRTAVR